MTRAFWTHAWKPVDAASLAVFRSLFGFMMAVGLSRFLLSGWVKTQFVEPKFFFKFYGFSWVKPLSELGMKAWVFVLIFLAFCIAVGLYARLAAALFAPGFAYLQLIDVTNYLNHYYFVVLMAGLLAIFQTDGLWSLKVWNQPSFRKATVPWWVLQLFRFQVAVIYIHAGLAKFGSDWLLHAQPLGIWLGARTELPVLGPLLGLPGIAYVLSWAGFLFDSTIVFFLRWKKTRAGAYLVVLLFHALTSLFFNIGMFPFIMVVSATLMFDESWPRRFLKPHSAPVEATTTVPLLTPARSMAVTALFLYVTFQTLFPFRHLIYPGDVLWNEEGMRFSWKVMVREKNGSVTFKVTTLRDGRRYEVNPAAYLLPRQLTEMSAQPDLILQMAHHVAQEFRKRGLGEVEVKAEAWVSLNGRPPALLLDPSVNLIKETDGWSAKRWILPAPSTPPVGAFLWAGQK